MAQSIDVDWFKPNAPAKVKFAMRNKPEAEPAIVLFRDDFRVSDHEALTVAVKCQHPVRAQGFVLSAARRADAPPYFRVFSPSLQDEKFDPAGDLCASVRAGISARAMDPSPMARAAGGLSAAEVRLG